MEQNNLKQTTPISEQKRKMKNRIPTIVIGFCIPVAAIILAFPFYNRLEPYILGFSFNYFWIFSWLILTSVCLMIAFRLDPYNTDDAVKATEATLQQVKSDLIADEKKMSLNDKQGGDL